MGVAAVTKAAEDQKTGACKCSYYTVYILCASTYYETYHTLGYRRGYPVSGSSHHMKVQGNSVKLQKPSKLMPQLQVNECSEIRLTNYELYECLSNFLFLKGESFCSQGQVD